MKKVLIIASSDNNENYITACENTGFNVTVSNEFVSSKNFDALVIPGGIDIDPSCYNEVNLGSENPNKEIDLIQLKEIDEFYKNNKAIFGTCRGLQILNVYFKGTLKQDIKGHRIDNNELHKTTIDTEFEFSNILGKELFVNSTHHQCIDILGKGFKVFERAEDGTIEGIYNKEKKILAVQWHPERIYDNAGQLIYQIFNEII